MALSWTRGDAYPAEGNVRWNYRYGKTRCLKLFLHWRFYRAKWLNCGLWRIKILQTTVKLSCDVLVPLKATHGLTPIYDPMSLQLKIKQCQLETDTKCLVWSHCVHRTFQWLPLWIIKKKVFFSFISFWSYFLHSWND